MKNKLILAVIVSLFVGVTGGFLVGKNQAVGIGGENRENFRGGTAGMGNRPGGVGLNRMVGFRPINGEIISVEEGSMTVKTEDGSTKLILVSDKTVYNQTTKINRDSLKVGDKIGAFGTTNQDGSVSAQNIQINPIDRPGNMNITEPIDPKQRE